MPGARRETTYRLSPPAFADGAQSGAAPETARPSTLASSRFFKLLRLVSTSRLRLADINGSARRNSPGARISSREVTRALSVPIGSTSPLASPQPRGRHRREDALGARRRHPPPSEVGPRPFCEAFYVRRSPPVRSRPHARPRRVANDGRIGSPGLRMRKTQTSKARPGGASSAK